MEKSAQLFETLPTDTCFPAFSLCRRAIAAARGYQKNGLIRCHPPSSSVLYFGAALLRCSSSVPPTLETENYE